MVIKPYNMINMMVTKFWSVFPKFECHKNAKRISQTESNTEEKDKSDMAPCIAVMTSYFVVMTSSQIFKTWKYFTISPSFKFHISLQYIWQRDGTDVSSSDWSTLIFYWFTSPPCCNWPRKCTPVNYKKMQKAGYTFVT